MSQRWLVGVSSVIFGLALGCGPEHHSNRPVASAGANANAEVGPSGGGVGAGAYGQVGPVEGGANAKVGANDHGAYVGGGAQGSVGGEYSHDDTDAAALACPMETPGAKVALAEVKGAIALDFTTNGDVMELRARVHKLAEAQSNATMSIDSAGGDMQGSGGREMHHDVAHIDARGTTQDLPNGIRVIFTPADPGQLDALRAQTQAEVTALNQGDCSSLEINGHQLRGPNNGKANRIPPPYDRKGPNEPTPAPNQKTPLQP